MFLLSNLEVNRYDQTWLNISIILKYIDSGFNFKVCLYPFTTIVTIFRYMVISIENLDSFCTILKS